MAKAHLSGNGAPGGTGQLQKNNKPAKRATKRVLTVEAGPVVADAEEKKEYGQSDSAKRQRKHRSREVPKHLRKYSFKPGRSGNPKGRPKGSISLTAKLRKLLAQPAYNGTSEKTKGDVVVEMAIAAAAQGDSNFFKEIMNRIDGKVSDHVVVETAQKMVNQEIQRVSAAVVEIAIELCDQFIPDPDKATEFVGELGERLVEVLATPVNTQEQQLLVDLEDGEDDDAE